MLGLVSSETIDDYWYQNKRRKIFYAYPNGTAPLTGLLSLMDSETTPNPEPGWQEDRWLEKSTTTVTGPTANNVFYTAGTTTSVGNTFTPTAGTQYRMYVNDASDFQVDDVVKVFGLTINSGGVKTEISGRVVLTNTTGTDYLEIVVLGTAPGAVTNNSATVGVNLGLMVVFAGSAYAEGSRSRSGTVAFPVSIFNYTQIFKTPFEMTGTALKAPTTYDKSGAYRDLLKRNGINHLAGIERASFFGDRRKETATDDDTSATVRRGYMGGLLWFLKQWEKGNTSDGGAFDYRPAGNDISAQTDYITYYNKRVIRLAGSSIPKANFNSLMTHLFERTISSSWDKLCLCGPDYLAKISDYFERQVTWTSMRENGFTGFDFQLLKHQSNSGTVYYKQHPLFTSAEMRSSAFYIDLGAVKYRPMDDRDTNIMKLIQLPDADKRKDQWLTECTTEWDFPEAHMYIENLGGVTN